MGVAHPSDRLVKLLLSAPERAGALLRERLPAEIVALLTDELPELVDGTFVDEALRESQTDRLFRVKLKTGQTAYVYCLIEHKSSADAWIGVQLLRYQARIYTRLQQEAVKRGASLLPMVVTLVLYDGATPWTGPRRFSDKVAVADPARPHVLDFPFGVFEVASTPSSRLSNNPVLQVGLTALQLGIRFPEGDVVETLVGILSKVPDDEPDLMRGLIYFMCLRYTPVMKSGLTEALRRIGIDESTVSKALQEILAEERAAAAQAAARAAAEASVRSKAETLRRQLEKRFGPAPQQVHERIGRASAEQLDTWLDHVLDAQSIEEIFKVH